MLEDLDKYDGNLSNASKYKVTLHKMYEHSTAGWLDIRML